MSSVSDVFDASDARRRLTAAQVASAQRRAEYLRRLRLWEGEPYGLGLTGKARSAAMTARRRMHEARSAARAAERAYLRALADIRERDERAAAEEQRVRRAYKETVGWRCAEAGRRVRQARVLELQAADTIDALVRCSEHDPADYSRWPGPAEARRMKDDAIRLTLDSQQKWLAALDLLLEWARRH